MTEGPNSGRFDAARHAVPFDFDTPQDEIPRGQLQVRMNIEQPPVPQAKIDLVEGYFTLTIIDPTSFQEFSIKNVSQQIAKGLKDQKLRDTGIELKIVPDWSSQTKKELLLLSWKPETFVREAQLSLASNKAKASLSYENKTVQARSSCKAFRWGRPTVSKEAKRSVSSCTRK